MTIPEKTRIPTDEDAVFRPKCWYRVWATSKVEPGTLVAVPASPSDFFIVLDKDNNSWGAFECLIEDIPQLELGTQDRVNCGNAANAIYGLPLWKFPQQGWEFWRTVHSMLIGMQANGTSDGKPYVKPEPQYREPNADDIGKMVEVRDDGSIEWRQVKLLGIVDDEFRFVVKVVDAKYPVGYRQAQIRIN